jgi:hypothetical protein
MGGTKKERFVERGPPQQGPVFREKKISSEKPPGCDALRPKMKISLKLFIEMRGFLED